MGIFDNKYSKIGAAIGIIAGLYLNRGQKTGSLVVNTLLFTGFGLLIGSVANNVLPKKNIET